MTRRLSAGTQQTVIQGESDRRRAWQTDKGQERRWRLIKNTDGLQGLESEGGLKHSNIKKLGCMY